MSVTLLPQLMVVSFGGLAGGLVLLVRGLQGYRQATRIGDVGTSRIASIAAGEVRISGVVEPAEVLLVSPLQSADCVYYRARVRQSEGNRTATVLDEERAVGFHVRDGTAAIRVFPRGAAWDVPARLDARDGMLGDTPAGLMPRMGPSMRAAHPDQDALVAQLLGSASPGSTADASWTGPSGAGDDGGSAGGTAGASSIAPSRDAFEGGAGGAPLAGDGRATAPEFALDDLVLMQSAGGFARPGPKHYVEARIEPGETITVIGSALPFSSLDDPDEADAARGSGDELAPGELDPEVAADLAAARAAGAIAPDAESAWGNAAIPGFGIGRPVRPPTLDSGVAPLPIATPAEVAGFRRQFEVAPDTLVIASGTDTRLLISSGAPGQAEARNQGRFFMGLAGALLAIVCAVAIALQLGGFGA